MSELFKLSEFAGFLEGELVDKFFEVFNVKLASGTWAAGGFIDRFMPKGYFPELPQDIISRIKRIKSAGIRGFQPVNTEFFNEKLEVEWDLVHRVKEYASKNNMAIAGLAIDLTGISGLKLGSITNPDPSLRELSFELLCKSLDVAKGLGAETASFWPGQDGWDYNFEVNYGKLIAMFTEGLRKLAEEAANKKLLLAIEAKPKEPKEGNMVIPTTHAAMAIAKRINEDLGEKVVGLTIDYGHELMYAVEPAYTVYLAKVFDVPLLAIHINTAKTHSNDEDRVVGTGNLWQFVDFLYATVDTGFGGWYILDQFTYRMNPVEGLRLSKELFANCMKKTLEIYRHREELEKLRFTGDQAKVVDFVKKILYVF